MRYLLALLLLGSALFAATKISALQIRGIDRIPAQGAMMLVMPDGTAKPVKLGTGFSLVADSDGILLLNFSNGGIVRMPNFQDGEVPAGVIDGVNVAFILNAQPIPAASLELLRNGLMLTAGTDYTLAGLTITFTAGSIPQPGDTLSAKYRF